MTCDALVEPRGRLSSLLSLIRSFFSLVQLNSDTVRNADGTRNAAGVLDREVAFVGRRPTATRRELNCSSVLSVRDDDVRHVALHLKHEGLLDRILAIRANVVC